MGTSSSAALPQLAGTKELGAAARCQPLPPEWGQHPEDRFPLEDPRALQHLAQEGYVVIAGVLSSDDVASSRSELWDVLEASAAAVRRDAAETWGAADWPADSRTGILEPIGVSHSPLLWRVRTAKGVRRPFERIWGTQRLLSSFDGAGVFRPLLHEGWRTKGGWYHVDQGARKRGLHCVQGLVSLYDASEATGSLVVVPRSHLCHDEIVAREREPSDMDYISLPSGDSFWNKAGWKPRVVRCRAGDLALWDSRTVHCNTPPLVEDQELQRRPELLRAVAYVCMTPASWAPWAVLRERVAGAENGIGTTHWPHEFQPTSPPDEEVPSWVPRAKLTPECRQLIDGGGDSLLLLAEAASAVVNIGCVQRTHGGALAKNIESDMSYVASLPAESSSLAHPVARQSSEAPRQAEALGRDETAPENSMPYSSSPSELATVVRRAQPKRRSTNVVYGQFHRKGMSAPPAQTAVCSVAPPQPSCPEADVPSSGNSTPRSSELASVVRGPNPKRRSKLRPVERA
eukprot:gnl/TRDRNA2_/TRDRNA2_165911_c0_seq3.p1 gnl/TRDRNA2_/TRDRNA2_165911_c0~~gnl/TRDRNA2_/TRDRNA2_165911_c0_seq3.p1  ORF type:complete len:516 (+),score=54.80 gnl/TRDRNA2_/TRDRNA2_165911_c0_seq3:114-1661(+)